MDEIFPQDLESIIDEAFNKIRDFRKIWAKPSLFYDTYLTTRRGVMIGCPVSPFSEVRSENGLSGLNRIAGSGSLSNARLMCVDDVPASWTQTYVPILESLSKAKESLILVSHGPQFEELFCETLLVNHLMETLPNAMLRPDSLSTQFEISLIQQDPPKAKLFSSGNSNEAQRLNINSLVTFSEVWIRRDASVGFVDQMDESLEKMVLNNIIRGPGFEEIAIIRVGGKSHTDVMKRMRILEERMLSW